MTRTRIPAAAAAVAAGGALLAGPAPHAAAGPPLDDNGVPVAGSYALGWTAAVQHTTWDESSPQRLMLISPTGDMRDVGPMVETEYIDDVSDDARHVVTTRELAPTPDGVPQSRVTVWDTSTRTSRTLTLNLSRGDTITFTRTGFLARETETRELRLRGFDGTLLRTYPKVAEAKGGGISVPRTDRFLEDIGSAVLVRSVSTGKVVNTVTPPQGMRNCSPQGGWDGSGFSMVCVSKSPRATPQVYRAGLNPGSPPVPVAPRGWSEARPSTPMVVSSGYGSRIARVVDGRPVDFALDAQLSGAVSNKAIWLSWSSQEQGGKLNMFNFTTGRLSRLSPGLFADAQTVDKVG